jgi:radical SAM protein with 4Fe4S-binding SPASM domain
MQELKKISEIKEWILSPYCKVIIGYTNAVIYDFKNRRAYQISKPAGFMLRKIFGEREIQKRNIVFKNWTSEGKDNPSKKLVENLPGFIEQLKKAKILIPLNVKKKRIKAFKIEIGFPIPNTPTFSILECTSRCNFHCPHCYLGEKSPIWELRLATIYRVLTQLQKLKVRSVLLTGGEICLREDLEGIITFAYQLGLKIEMSTNGSLLYNKRLIDLIEKYVDKIQVTLYGVSEKTYRKFSSTRNIFEKVLLGIEKLQQRKPQALLVTFTLTPFNYQDLPEFLRFVDEKKLKYKIGRTLPIGLALKDKNLLLNPCYNSFLEEFERECLKETTLLFRNRGCPLDRITVLSDGKVTICPLLRNSKFIFGDINHSDLETIWYKKMKPSFSLLYVDELEICRNCEFRYLCGGGCPALWDVLGPIKRRKTPPCSSSYLTVRYCLKPLELKRSEIKRR